MSMPFDAAFPEDDTSLAQQLSMLSLAEQEEALDGMDVAQLMHDWTFWGRPSQLFQPPFIPVDAWLMLYIAGRGCVAPQTRIYLPLTDQHVPIATLAQRAESVTVMTANGPKVSDGPPFLKLASAPMWTVILEDGSSVTATDEHRFLTPQGWQRLDRVRVGQLLAAVSPVVPPGSSSVQSTSPSSAQRSTRTEQGSQCRCLTCPHCGDPRPHQVPDTDRSVVPSPIGADARSQLSSLLDDQGLSARCSHACRLTDLPTRSSSAQFEPLRGGALRPNESAQYAPIPLTPREVLRLLDTSASRRTAPVRAQKGRPLSDDDRIPVASMRHLVGRGASLESAHSSAPTRVVSPGRGHHAAHQETSESRLRDTQLQSRLVRCRGASGLDAQRDLTRWSRVVSIEYAGEFPVYDITVPGEAHYLAEGIFHHNTGKTRSGAEFADYKANSMPGSRGLLVARTSADARDVLVDGDSGLLHIGDPATRPLYEPSKRRLTWKNGSTASLFTADEPDQLRGPQGHWAVGDEIATWSSTPDASGLTAWDNLRIATRLGKYPQILGLTTPKRTPLMKALLKMAEEKDNVILRRGRTADNMGNLSAAYLDVVYGLYGGTRLAKQELDGEMLDDVDGALWTQDKLNATRIAHADGLPRVPLLYIIAVDPSVAENPTDECGIIVCACTTESDLHKRQFYVIEDASILGSPNVWAKKVVEKAQEYGAPVVAEVNQGGALVRSALVSIDPTIKVFDVRARYGKLTRAEPVSLFFEQGRGHLYGWHPDLESQLTSWTPSDRKSPDRLDAMVWGATALLIKPPPGLYSSPIRAHSVAAMRFSAPALPASSLNPHIAQKFPYLAARGFTLPGQSGPAGRPGRTRSRSRVYNRKLPKFSVTIPR